MEEMGKERRNIWADLVVKARKGEKITDKELETARNKSKALDKKINAEKEKFANGLGDVLTNEQQVLFHIFGREMVSEAKERMRDHQERGKDMGRYKKKRKRW
jgi:hemerythrin-like domain-containing protein